MARPRENFEIHNSNHPVRFPTILIMSVAVVGPFNGRDLFQELGISPLVGLFPVLGFAICVALIFIFANAKEWKIAAVIKGISLLFAILLGFFFALMEYNG